MKFLHNLGDLLQYKWIILQAVKPIENDSWLNQLAGKTVFFIIFCLNEKWKKLENFIFKYHF
jgi:hypothetical protein